MDLRQKFGLLALIYVLSLSANFVMSALCIVVYFESAFEEYQAGAQQEQRIERVRQILRRQQALIEEARPAGELLAEYQGLEDQFTSILQAVTPKLEADSAEPLLPALERAIRRKDAVARRFLAGRGPEPVVADLSEEDTQAFLELDLLLLQASSVLGQHRQQSVAGAARTQERVVTILVVNTACGVVLCSLGVFFVRRWVLTPVRQLREATKQISRGNFAYRIQSRSRDELGQLAGEVNQMSGTIVTMQTQLVEQERLAAAGEMVTRLAHNIRNPLAGIRGLAETTVHQHPHDPDTLGCQQRIIDTVDRFEKWLRDLQQSVSPLELHCRRVAVDRLLGDVMTALRPMCDRRGVKVEVEVDPAMGPVQLDGTHFEQALVALVTNAVQASAGGQTVRVLAHPLPESPGRWRLRVEDHGVGIPPEIQSKIFLPYFTTKPDGNGIGLAIASKVVRLHGGELTVQSEVGRGSRFDAVLPGLVTESSEASET